MILMQRRNEQWGFCWGVFAAACLFMAGTFLSPNSMGQSLYGPYAQAIEAEAWAAGYIGASLLSIYGILINGRWRWSPMIRTAGFAVMSGMFGFLGFSAWAGAADGVVVWAFTFGFFLPQSLRFLFLNIRDAAARWGSHERSYS